MFALFVGGMGCGGKLTIQSVHPNGQLVVLTGPEDWRGRREGLWVYYDPEGRELYDDTAPDGRPRTLTGVYSAGVRIRLPSAAELADARVRAEERRRPRRE